MSVMTTEDRVRNLEGRLEMLERLFLEYHAANAHLSVGGEAWVRADQEQITEARHRE